MCYLLSQNIKIRRNFSVFSKKMTDDHKNTKKEGYKRVLIYCSSKDQLDETISSLPIIDGYWDAFDNLQKAIDAIKKGDYGIVFCESTLMNPADRDLVLAAHARKNQD